MPCTTSWRTGCTGISGISGGICRKAASLRNFCSSLFSVKAFYIWCPSTPNSEEPSFPAQPANAGEADRAKKSTNLAPEEYGGFARSPNLHPLHDTASGLYNPAQAVQDRPFWRVCQSRSICPLRVPVKRGFWHRLRGEIPCSGGQGERKPACLSRHFRLCSSPLQQGCQPEERWEERGRYVVVHSYKILRKGIFPEN